MFDWLVHEKFLEAGHATEWINTNQSRLHIKQKSNVRSKMYAISLDGND